MLILPVSSGTSTTRAKIPSSPSGEKAICFHDWYRSRNPGMWTKSASAPPRIHRPTRLVTNSPSK